MITVNVSGTRFEIGYDIIINIPYFKNTLSCNTQKIKEDIRVNRSSLIFQHILAWAIDNKHPFPEEYIYELEFYLIDIEKVNIDRKLQQIYDMLNVSTTFLYNRMLEYEKRKEWTKYDRNCIIKNCENRTDKWGDIYCKNCTCKINNCMNPIISKDEKYCDLHCAIYKK